jgi:quercetin dioxygenase-like cupin family protein
VKSSMLFTAALVPALALAQSQSYPPNPPPPDKPAQAQPTMAASASSHAMVHAADTKWGPAPPAFPKGAQAAVLYGDPGKAGPFAIRLKAPAGYKVPRHWHSADEQVTIIEGDFALSMGEMGNTHDGTFAPGDYISMPAKMQHEATTKNGVVVQVNAVGPFDMNYVDPKDDPRNAKP